MTPTEPAPHLPAQTSTREERQLHQASSASEAMLTGATIFPELCQTCLSNGTKLLRDERSLGRWLCKYEWGEGNFHFRALNDGPGKLYIKNRSLHSLETMRSYMAYSYLVSWMDWILMEEFLPHMHKDLDSISDTHKDLDSISDTTENTQVLLSLLSRIDISFFLLHFARCLQNHYFDRVS